MQIMRDVPASGHNYVLDDVLHIGSVVDDGIIIESASQIDDLPDYLPVGTVVHTAGWQLAKEKAADGTWVTAIGG